MEREAEHLKYWLSKAYVKQALKGGSSRSLQALLHGVAAAAHKAAKESTSARLLRHAEILAIGRGVSLSVAPIPRWGKVDGRSRCYSAVPLGSELLPRSKGQIEFLSGAARSVAGAASAVRRVNARGRTQGAAASLSTLGSAALAGMLPGRKVGGNARTRPLTSELLPAAAAMMTLARRQGAGAAGLRRPARMLGVKSALPRLHHGASGAASLASDRARISGIAPRGATAKHVSAASQPVSGDADLKGAEVNEKLQVRSRPAESNVRQHQLTDQTRAADQEASLRQALEDLFDRQARLPPSGITGFDPRLTPAWAGRKLPG